MVLLPVAQLTDSFVNELKICCHVIRKGTGSIINIWVRGYRTGLMCVSVSGYCCLVFSMGPKPDYADVVMADYSQVVYSRSPSPSVAGCCYGNLMRFVDHQQRAAAGDWLLTSPIPQPQPYALVWFSALQR